LTLGRTRKKLSRFYFWGSKIKEYSAALARKDQKKTKLWKTNQGKGERALDYEMLLKGSKRKKGFRGWRHAAGGKTNSDERETRTMQAALIPPYGDREREN